MSIIGHHGQVKNLSTIDIGVGDVVRASFYLSKSLKKSKTYLRGKSPNPNFQDLDSFLE